MNYSVKIDHKECISTKNPQETELGRKIISKSIDLIHELGFENFNFKHLAEEINSTQASVYRYFENKHKLLLYLTSWYWSWLEFLINFNSSNISDPKIKMETILREIAHTGKFDPNIPHIDEEKLYQIVITESSKAFRTKNIDSEVRQGFFVAYSSLCNTIAIVIQELNPNYPYALTLASNIIETAHEQIYFAEHLPEVTDMCCTKKNKPNEQIHEFLTHLVNKLVYY